MTSAQLVVNCAISTGSTDVKVPMQPISTTVHSSQSVPSTPRPAPQSTNR